MHSLLSFSKKEFIESFDNIVTMGSFFKGKSKNICTFGLGGCEAVYAELDNGEIFLSHYPPTQRMIHTKKLFDIYCQTKRVIFLYPEKWEKNNDEWSLVDKNDTIDFVRSLFNKSTIVNIQYNTSILFGNNLHGLFWVNNGVPYFEGKEIRF